MLTSIFALPCVSQAQSNNQSTVKRCPAGSTGCTTENFTQKVKEAVRDGVETVGTNQNNNNKSVGKRVRGVKKTIEYCMDCGWDAVTDAADKILEKDKKNGKD